MLKRKTFWKRHPWISAVLRVCFAVATLFGIMACGIGLGHLVSSRLGWGELEPASVFIHFFFAALFLGLANFVLYKGWTAKGRRQFDENTRGTSI